MKVLSAFFVLVILASILAVYAASSVFSQSTPTPSPSTFSFSSSSKWISAPSSSSPSQNLFRSPAFTLSNPAFTTASLYISGLGFSAVTVNGRTVSDMQTGNQPVLEPGLTDFTKQALFVQYDVTSLLQGSSNNVIGVQLGNGWMMKQGFNMQPRLRAELVIDGQSVLFSQPEEWVCAQGSIVSDNIYNGETWNASLEVLGWDTGVVPPTQYRCSSNPVTWSKTLEVADYNPKMVQRNFPAMSVVNVYPPQTLWFPDNNTLVVDFGADISGVARFNIKGTSGTITAHYGEILDHYNPGQSQYVYFDNLRSAKATDTYILPNCNKASSGIYTYQPSFTYHGFRFVQITATGDVDLNFISANIEALQINTDLKLVSDYSSSTPIFNSIHNRVLGAQSGNFMSYTTNCNQRDDRLGVDADAWLASSAAYNNWDSVHEFYSNHINVIISDQNKLTGALNDVNPVLTNSNMPQASPADPAWGLVLPYLTNLLYAETANEVELANSFSANVNWAADIIAIEAQYDIDNVTPRFGDVAPPPPAKQVTNGFAAGWAFIYTMQEMITMSAAMNNVTLFQYYNNVLDVLVVDSFISRFYDAFHQNFDIEGNQQSTWALPITLPKVISEAETASNGNKNVKFDLLKQIESATYHFNTGILGLRFLFEETSKELNRPDLASQMLLQTEYPSYAYQWLNDIETPTTTNLWEVWNAPQVGPSSNSRDHIRTSSVDTFLFENVGGFQSAKTVIHRTANKRVGKKMLGSSSQEHQAAMKDIRGLYDKYANYNTLVFDASPASYDIPSLRHSRVAKKVSPKKTVSFSWRKEGGDNLCYQFARGSSNNGDSLVNLDCGAEGGNIVEIDSVFITGSIQGPNCASFFPREQDKSAEHKAHEAKLHEELKKRCIGNRGCRLSGPGKWWNNKLHKRTDSLFVRGRCSAPSKIVVEIESSAASPYELFVPTFGLSKPSVRVVSSNSNSNQHNIERRSDVVAAHPLLKSVVSRGGMHSVASPSVALVHGSLAADEKLTVIVSAEESTTLSSSSSNNNNNKKFTSVLHGLQQQQQQSSSSSATAHLGSCAAAESSSSALLIKKVDRMDSQLIQQKCTNANKISISRLVHEIETSCVGKKSCDVSISDILMMSKRQQQIYNLVVPASCVEALSHSVSFACGEKGGFFYTQQDVENGHN